MGMGKMGLYKDIKGKFPELVLSHVDTLKIAQGGIIRVTGRHFKDSDFVKSGQVLNSSSFHDK